MLEQNVMIGMKVVAHNKSVPCYQRSSGFMGGHDFLYVTRLDEVETKHNRGRKVFRLNAKPTGNGNYYFASDFEPIDLITPKETMKPFDVNSVTINPCAEVVLDNTTTFAGAFQPTFTTTVTSR